MSRGAEFFEKARQLGVELERKPAERIVIAGMSAITSLGNTEQTLEGLNRGKSGVKLFDAKNSEIKIASPVEFNPGAFFSRKEARGISPLNMMVIVIAREAMRKANLLGEDGKLRKDIDRRQVASWMASAFGSSHMIVDVYNRIHKKDDDGNEDPETNSRFVPVRAGLQIFPEELNGQVAIDLGISGWGGSSVEACATGLSNIVEAADRIKTGKAKIAIAGGFEDVLSLHPEVGISMFAAMGVLSKRNNDPEKASRPFDRDRDGFVLGAGGGAVVLEEYEHALKRGVPILGEVLGYAKSMGGSDSTNLDKDVVASTILGALYNKRAKKFYGVDAIFAHATSTKEGDIAEAAVLRKVFGNDYLRKIPITAVKSNLGHLAGGAGTVNVIVAINALNTGEIPPIINLDNPDPEVTDLNFVRGKSLKKGIKTALVLAYGFGGHNAVMLLGKYNE